MRLLKATTELISSLGRETGSDKATTAGVGKEYLTLLGESTHTFENFAYVIGIVAAKFQLYIPRLDND